MITNRQFALLALCATLDEPIRCKDAGLDLQISGPAISRCIDNLSEKSFLKRLDRNRDEDLRQVFIEITPQGTKFLASLGVAS
jgi:DNA-binding MarR family transcriptional regulator